MTNVRETIESKIQDLHSEIKSHLNESNAKYFEDLKTDLQIAKFNYLRSEVAKMTDFLYRLQSLENDVFNYIKVNLS